MKYSQRNCDIFQLLFWVYIKHVSKSLFSIYFCNCKQTCRQMNFHGYLFVFIWKISFPHTQGSRRGGGLGVQTPPNPISPGKSRHHQPPSSAHGMSYCWQAHDGLLRLLVQTPSPLCKIKWLKQKQKQNLNRPPPHKKGSTPDSF